LAALLVLGGWFAVELVVLSYSKGIVHPYYISALAPGAAAMVGAGVSASVDFARGRDPRLLLLVLAVVGTVAAQIVILEQQDYLQWFVPLLIVGAAVGLLALAVRRLALPAVTFLLAVLLVAPTAYATTTWLAPAEGTFPAAGPHEATGFGLYGVDEKAMRENRKLVAYVDSHRPASRWSVLADASPTAAPLILLGSPAGALGGYGASDPVLDGRSLARLIARGEARYVVLGGAYADRGGNAATAAVLHDCPQVPHDAWHGSAPGPRVLVLFDCLGREHALEAHPRG
jgi:4-amino-4-deoxy-L-arabinose transferase-like glycosyltransferase